MGKATVSMVMVAVAPALAQSENPIPASVIQTSAATDNDQLKGVGHLASRNLRL